MFPSHDQGGSAFDFGDAAFSSSYTTGTSNETRGIFGTGFSPSWVNTVNFVTIQSLGNAIDFGDTTTTVALATMCSSPTRGIRAGGTNVPGGATDQNIIDFAEIATTGNFTDFGDLTSQKRSMSSMSSNVRGVFAGAKAPGTTDMDFITIASTGNASDFGDALAGTTENARGTSNNTRGIFGRGSVSNIIEFITIASTGNATDFGDLTVARTSAEAMSGSHGGIE